LTADPPGVGPPTPLTRGRQETVVARMVDRRHPRVFSRISAQASADDGRRPPGTVLAFTLLRGDARTAPKEISMKVTPLDLRQAQFRSKLRGFDPDEVTPFLADAAYELEQALKEIDRLRQEAARKEVVLEEFRERENALRNTLLTAQRLADQIKENAEAESKTILREAESRADLILQKAQGRLTELDRDINEMRVRRRDVEGSLEAAIASLSYALDSMRTHDHQSERDEKLLLHRPKMDATTAQIPVARPA
jgi:cell division initiation protein